MEVREDDETFENPVDLAFKELAQREPQHFAVRQYAKYKLAAGVTTTIKLYKRSGTPGEMMVNNEGSANNNGDSEDTNSSASELLPLELVESGWAVKDSLDKYYVQYAIVIKNPNSDKAAKYPQVRLTARDANGGVLGTHDMVGNPILPGETWVAAFQGASCDSEPVTVDFNIIQPDDSDWIDPSRLDYSGDPLTILNPPKRSDKITGEISNSNDYDISTVAVAVIFRDAEGKISYGETTYVDGVLGGATTPFELSMWGSEEFMTDSFEIYAIPWM